MYEKFVCLVLYEVKKKQIFFNNIKQINYCAWLTWGAHTNKQIEIAEKCIDYFFLYFVYIYEKIIDDAECVCCAIVGDMP